MAEKRLREKKAAAGYGITESLAGRDTVYDWLRIFATLLVVFGHSSYLDIHTLCGGISYSVPAAVSPAWYSPLLTFFRDSVVWITSFHMQLFFMLSGAVMAIKPPDDLLRFTKNKLRRLIVPYYLCGLLFVIPVKLLAGYYDKNTVLRAVFYFLPCIEKTHLWFLPVLFICMMLFAPVCIYLKRSDRLDNAAFMLLPALLVHVIDRNGILYIRFLSVVATYLLWFLIGFVFETVKNRRRKWSLLQLAVGIISLIAVEILTALHGIDLGHYMTVITRCSLLFLAAGLCDVLFGAFTGTKTWKVIVRNLFNIYLFHDPLEYVVIRAFMDRGWLGSAAGCYLFYVLRSAGVIVICIIIGEVLRKMKSLFGRKQRRA